ncbi:hypothetical protein ACHFCA_10450 [Delftia tsuruhatensis]
MSDHHDTDWLLEELGATMELSGQQVRPAALLLLAEDLAHIDKPVLRLALARIRAEHRGPILTGTVLQYVDHAMGRMLPAEAYGLALTSADQQATVVWTDEIAQAWAVAAPLLDAGDKFGARQAFIEAYGRITGEARALRRRPVVQVSLGHDPEARTRAVQEAITAGRLPGGLEGLTDDLREQLQLPAPRAALALPAPESMPSGPKREVLSKLATLREAFALKASRFTPVQVQARADRMRVGQAKRRAAAAVAQHQQEPAMSAIHPAATRAYLALPYAYSLAQELSASERQPLHQRKREPMAAAVLAAVHAVGYAVPTVQHWRDLADAANLSETLLGMGVFTEPEAQSLFADAVAAVVDLGRKHGHGQEMRLNAVQLGHLVEFGEAYGQVLEVIPARTFIRAHRATERRLRELLVNSHGSDTHEFIVV